MVTSTREHEHTHTWRVVAYEHGGLILYRCRECGLDRAVMPDEQDQGAPIPAG